MSAINFLDKYDNFLIDLDGVIWNGHNPIAGSPETIEFLLSHNKKVFFVTNNPSATHAEFQVRFTSMNIKIPSENVYTSLYAVVNYLKKYHPSASKVVVLGMPGLINYLKETGYQVIYPPELRNTVTDIQSLLEFDVEEGADVVIAAYDTGFDYFAALYCSVCLQKGASFVGMNMDKYFMFGHAIIPASGCGIRFIEAASRVKVECFGKPLRFLFDVIVEEQGIDPKRTVMIGDSMESDVLFGINSGIDTILVLSGVTKMGEVENFEFKPNYVLESLAKVME